MRPVRSGASICMQSSKSAGSVGRSGPSSCKRHGGRIGFHRGYHHGRTAGARHAEHAPARSLRSVSTTQHGHLSLISHSGGRRLDQGASANHHAGGRSRSFRNPRSPLAESSARASTATWASSSLPIPSYPLNTITRDAPLIFPYAPEQ